MAHFTLVYVYKNYIERLREAMMSSSQFSCSVEEDSKQGLSEYKVLLTTQPRRSVKLFGGLKMIATIILNGNLSRWFMRM
jgi:hypothetical protein